MYVTDKYLKSKNIKHGFFGRNGGVSNGVYHSLNCGLDTNDDPECVTENRRRVCDFLGYKDSQLLSLKQVHGGECIQISKTWSHDKRPLADALATDIPGTVLSIMTADCAPVMFYGEKHNKAPVIGIAHVGWRGIIAGVMNHTYKAMLEMGAVEGRVRAVIGPCIGLKSYEVSDDFKQPFLNQHTGSDYYFHTSKKKGHAMFDFPGYINRRLHMIGIKKVDDLALNTFEKDSEYFSHRRATLSNESETGRQISVIAI